MADQETDEPKKKGGLVKIKNLSSDKIFHAKVLNENSVKVHL